MAKKAAPALAPLAHAPHARKACPARPLTLIAENVPRPREARAQHCFPSPRVSTHTAAPRKWSLPSASPLSLEIPPLSRLRSTASRLTVASAGPPSDRDGLPTSSPSTAGGGTSRYHTLTTSDGCTTGLPTPPSSAGGGSRNHTLTTSDGCTTGLEKENSCENHSENATQSVDRCDDHCESDPNHHGCCGGTQRNPDESHRDSPHASAQYVCDHIRPPHALHVTTCVGEPLPPDPAAAHGTVRVDSGICTQCTVTLTPPALQAGKVRHGETQSLMVTPPHACGMTINPLVHVPAEPTVYQMALQTAGLPVACSTEAQPGIPENPLAAPPPEVTTADPIKVGHEVIWMLQQQINTLTHLNSMLLQQWQQLQQLQPVLQQN
jgi:hypothetical protein